MHVVLVYLEWFRCSLLLKCVLQPKIAENSLNPPIWGVQGRSMVSDVGSTGKLVGSACYDKQELVCVYLQPFSR